MAEEDCTTAYRKFFENVVETVQLNDPLPLRVASYNLTEEELLGQVVDCCVQYLYLINCPTSLLTTLAKNAVEEVYGEYKKQPPQNSYVPLKVMQNVTRTVVEICRRYLDNEALSSLPPPSTAPLLSALGIKHARRTMEDRMVYLPQLNTLYNVPTEHETGYYAIFDGHNGSDAASFAVSHLHQFLIESPNFHSDIVAAFREAYEKTDAHFTSKESHGGSTGLAILHQPTLNRLVVSWLGDSQAMLIKAGRPIMLVEPHTPRRADETARIQNQGGFVVEMYGVYRVNGEIAVSRSFGDRNYKPLVSAEPDVKIIDLDGSEEVLVLGCDGLWDFATPAQVCETLQFQIHHEPDRIDLLSRRLVDLAKENGSLDNISVITVLLKPPSEVTAPGTAMETPELEPFRTPAPANVPGKQEQDDDFGPETDVDALDDSNPFNDDCWTRPDPVQSFPDFSGLKPTPGMRLNNDFGSSGFDNPFSSNNPLQDIAEEKYVEDLKPEKEKLNGFENAFTNGGGKTDGVGGFNNFVSNGVHKFDGNGFDGFNSKDDNENGLDTFNVEETENGFMEPAKSDRNVPLEGDLFGHNSFQSASGLPDLIQDRDASKPCLASPFDDDFKPKESENADFKPKESNEFNPLETKQFESQKEELFSTLDEKDVEDDANPFDRSTPEPEAKVPEKVDTTTEKTEAVIEKVEEIAKPFELEEGKLQLETLKSMMLAEESSQLEEPLQDLNNASPGLEDNLLDSSDVSPQGIPAGDAIVPKASEPVDYDVGAEVVETVGEGDESEEEWNYYKVEQNQQDPGSMNSPLNPNAAEFVPVSPPTGLAAGSQTPVKAIPQNLLDDVVITSPNWANMDHVEVPKLEDFLAGAKSCPADLGLDPNVESYPADLGLDPNVEPFEMPAKEPVDLDEEPLAVPLPADAMEEVLEAVKEPVKEVASLISTGVEAEPVAEMKMEDVSIESIPQVDEVPPVLEPLSPEPARNDIFEAPVTVNYSPEPPTPPARSPEPIVEVLLDQAAQKTVATPEVAQVLEDPLLSASENVLETAPAEELRGLDLAKDMTSSFIDPSTIGDDDFGSETPRSTIAEPASTPPSTPLTAELTPASAPPSEIEEVVEKLAATNIAAVATAGAVATVGAAAAATASAKKAPSKTSPAKSTPLKSAAKPTTTAAAATPKSATAAKKAATPSATRSPAPAKPAPTKPPVKTTPTASSAAAAKPRVPSATSRPASTATVPKPATTTAAPKPKPTTTTTTKAPLPAAAKPAVKSTIPPRTTAPPKPRVPAAQTNGDAKAEKKAEAPKKPTVTAANRVPLSARPASAPTRTTTAPAAKPASSVAAKTTAAKPATSRPATARTATTTTVAKPKTTSTVPPAKKPVATATKTNGVAAKPAPAKRAPTKSAETKTEPKTVANSCDAAVINGSAAATPLTNGVTVSE